MSTAQQSTDAATTDIDELRDEIERTREELVATTQALSDKLDVKKQVGSAAESARFRLLALVDRARASVRRDPVPLAVGVATFVVAMIVGGTREARR